MEEERLENVQGKLRAYKLLSVIPAKAGIQCRASARRISYTARGHSPLDPRLHGDDVYLPNQFPNSLFSAPNGPVTRTE